MVVLVDAKWHNCMGLPRMASYHTIWVDISILAKVEKPKTVNDHYQCTRLGWNDSCVDPKMATCKGSSPKSMRW